MVSFLLMLDYSPISSMNTVRQIVGECLVYDFINSFGNHLPQVFFCFLFAGSPPGREIGKKSGIL